MPPRRRLLQQLVVLLPQLQAQNARLLRQALRLHRRLQRRPMHLLLTRLLCRQRPKRSMGQLQLTLITHLLLLHLLRCPAFCCLRLLS